MIHSRGLVPATSEVTTWLTGGILWLGGNPVSTDHAEAGEAREMWNAEIVAHQLYKQLVSPHIACLRITTPVTQLQRINAQLAPKPYIYIYI